MDYETVPLKVDIQRLRHISIRFTTPMTARHFLGCLLPFDRVRAALDGQIDKPLSTALYSLRTLPT
jgi:hypothetical protein